MGNCHWLKGKDYTVLMDNRNILYDYGILDEESNEEDLKRFPKEVKESIL